APQVDSSDQRGAEGGAATAERDAQPLGDRRAEIREGRTRAERLRTHARAQRQQRDVLPAVVGGRRGRVVAVVGGDEQQVVLAEGGDEVWQRGVEVAQCLMEPRNIVPVPEGLVE